LFIIFLLFIFIFYQGIFHMDALARTPITPGTSVPLDRLSNLYAALPRIRMRSTQADKLRQRPSFN
jgi:hypothetical protein